MECGLSDWEVLRSFRISSTSDNQIQGVFPEASPEWDAHISEQLIEQAGERSESSLNS